MTGTGDPKGRGAADSSGPSRRAIAGWTAAMLAALGLTWFVAAVAVPVWQVHFLLKECAATGGYSPDRDIDRLGGPAGAARKLELYLRMPRCIAGEKRWAIVLLQECGEPGIPVLAEAGAEPSRRGGEPAPAGTPGEQPAAGAGR